MNNPVAPGAGSLEALLRQLIEQWKLEAKYNRESCESSPIYLAEDRGTAEGYEACAKELEALLASAGCSPWQPIETAPKDGTKILVAFRLKASADCFAGESSWQGYWFQVDETDLVEVYAWMPMPLPPVPVQPPPLKE